MQEPVITVSDIKKVYRLGQYNASSIFRRARSTSQNSGALHANKNQEFWALKGISFTLKQGEALGIIGHNGSGKSTLLKILAQITAPTEGEACIRGKVASMLEVGTGFNPDMTGYENIFLNGAILGMSRNEVRAKLDQIIEFSECGDFINTPVKRYSSGMYVKLAFSVAAHLDSDILLMDEVLAVGDAKFQEKCLDKMKRVVKEEGRTVVFVSHSMANIRTLCSRCIQLEHGNLVFDGEVEDAIRNYTGIETTARTTYLLEEKARPEGFFYPAVMRQLAFVNKEMPIYRMNEQMHMKLLWTSEETLDTVYLFLRILRGDGTPVGIALSDEPISISAGAEQISQFMFDISALAPDTYVCDIALTDFAEGTTYNYDYLFHAVEFVVEPDDSIIGVVPWWAASWGSMVFPRIQVLDQAHDNKKMGEKMP